MHLRSLWMREAAGRGSALGNTVQASALAQEDTTTYSRHRLIQMNSHKTQRWNESVGRLSLSRSSCSLEAFPAMSQFYSKQSQQQMLSERALLGEVGWHGPR